jgi:hypothetical protein
MHSGSVISSQLLARMIGELMPHAGDASDTSPDGPSTIQLFFSEGISDHATKLELPSPSTSVISLLDASFHNQIPRCIQTFHIRKQLEERSVLPGEWYALVGSAAALLGGLSGCTTADAFGRLASAGACFFPTGQTEVRQLQQETLIIT